VIPVNVPKTFVYSATLLVMAVNVHANPRGVTPEKEIRVIDTAPLAIEFPADMLSTDTLHVESAPAIDVEEIAVFDIPGEGDEPMPGSWQPDDALHEHAMSEAYKQQRPDSEPDVELADVELDRELQDDVRLQEMTPRIELDVPAPVISLDF